MPRKRASMREGPLADLFRATEAAQRQGDAADPGAESTPEPQEQTVEHVPTWEESAENVVPITAEPQPASESARPEPKQRAKPKPKPAEPKPAQRYLDPLPEPPPRLHRATPTPASYLAVIR